MSPKRLILFLMLTVCAPVWLLLRSRFGDRFFVLLLFAWGSGYGLVWFCSQPNFKADFGIYWPVFHVLREWYWITAPVWIAQFAMIVLQRLGSMLGELQPPEPMYSGTFWFARSNFAVTDFIGVAVLGHLIIAEMNQRVPDIGEDVQMGVFAIMGVFVVLAYLCFLNDQVFPLRPEVRRPKLKVTRYLARLRTTAGRSREGLGAIFSRRDPALMKLTRQ